MHGVIDVCFCNWFLGGVYDTLSQDTPIDTDNYIDYRSSHHVMAVHIAQLTDTDLTRTPINIIDMIDISLDYKA